jgi:hypothetical protein
MTQDGQAIRAKDFGYVSADQIDELTPEELAAFEKPGKVEVMKATFNKPQPGIEVPYDAVSNPAHYHAKGIECLDVIEALGLDYHLGNVVKYIFRAESKGNYLQDLRKARFYLDRHITLLEKAE